MSELKKIGLLVGREWSFPPAFLEEVNSRNAGVVAEYVKLGGTCMNEPCEYAVLVDRISHEIPYYRTYMKNAMLQGAYCVNNPFWWSADEKFFNNCLATKIDVPVPKTVILPSRELPTDTSEESFSNLAYPLDWEGIFKYIGFPAYMKPFAGGGWKSVYQLNSIEEFFEKHAETEQLVMMLQEEIKFDEYYRCYCVGGKYVRIMPYEPRNPHHLRYVADFKPSPERYKLMEDIVLRICNYLGYDFNTVELAIRNGIPYAIDFCNPAPDAEVTSVGQENFDWVVETAALFAIEKAQTHVEGADNLTWGEYIKRSSTKTKLY